MSEKKYREQEKEFRITERRIKKSYSGVEKDLKEAKIDLKEALEEAQQVALKRVQAEVDKLLGSAKVKVSPVFVRNVLSSIVKHVKQIYFGSDNLLEERIKCQEITYEDCQRELRQSTLLNYWSLQKFKVHLKLSRIYENKVRQLIEEDRNLTDRSIENLTRQAEKTEKLMGKSKNDN